jgi:protein phosphatase
VALGVLGGLLWGGWAWSQSKYYVGASPDGMVAVFQGVPGQIAGVHLNKVHQPSDTRVGDLTRVAQDKVRQGIPANNEADAQRKLADLIDPANGNVVAACPSPSMPAVTPSGFGSAVPTSPNAPTSGESPGSTGVAPSASASPHPSVQNSGSPSPDPVVTPSSSGC